MIISRTSSVIFTGIILVIMNGCISYRPYENTNTNSSNEPLQNILDQAVNEYKLPGLQAGIKLPNGKTLLASSGTIDFGRKQPHITNNNIFRIGSTTKMFVAALIGRLNEKGLLSYDDTLDKWFPDLPFASTVNIRELLNHTSCIEESLFTSPTILAKSFLFSHTNWNTEEVVYDLMQDMKVIPAGQRSFKYANNNYLLLGLIAERTGGDKIHVQLQKEFFIPLKMKNTYLLPYYKKLPDGLISGFDEYIPLGPHEIDPDNTAWDSLTFSAGAMASSAEDLLIWLDALFHNRVLKPETLETMRHYLDARNNGRDDSIVAYGLGLAQYDINGDKLEGHPGGGFGGECFPFYFPEKDISIVVSYNWSKKNNPAGKMIIQQIIRQITDNPETIK